MRKLRLGKVRVFLTGTNLFCWTNYSGFDPDVNVSSGMAQYLLPGLDYFFLSAGENLLGRYQHFFLKNENYEKCA